MMNYKILGRIIDERLTLNVNIRKMPINTIVKRERIKKGMSQAELASGICSNTYLSKYENGKIELVEEMVSDICEKLDLSYYCNDEISREIIEIIERVNSLILLKQYDDIVELKSDIIDLKENYQCFDLDICYGKYSVVNRDYIESKEIIESLDSQLYNFSNNQLLEYIHLVVMYYLMIEDNVNAIIYVQKGITLQKMLGMYNPLFDYHYAWCLVAENDYYNAKQFAEKAYDYFYHTDNLLRAMEVRLILLIIEGEMTSESVGHTFNHYIEVIGNLGYNELTSLAIYNLCFMYNQKQMYSESIDSCLKYLHQCRGYFKINIQIILADNYLSIEKKQDSINILNKLKDNEYIVNNKSLQVFYQYVVHKSHDNHELFKEYLRNEAIPYYKENNKKQMLKRCYIALTDLFERDSQYKEAVRIYKKILNLNYKGGGYNG